MNPKIEKNIVEKDGILKFTLSGVNTSIANSIRRTILSDIPTVVFKTTPYEENKCNIISNTTRLNNEIIKQRLSCVPIHISDLTIPLKNYLLEVNVENLTNTIIYVTTEHFKIKNLVNNTYLSEKDTRAIFPANEITGYFIDFVRLRPRISDDIPGEKINLTCEFSISNAKNDGMFNVVSTSSYGCTQDDGPRYVEALEKKKQEWKNLGLKQEDINYEETNWKLLDGKRIIKKDSFDFIIESVGVYTNQEIIHKACDIIINGLNNIHNLIETDEIHIEPSINTMSNCFDITLVNVSDTLGRVIQFMVYSKFYEELKTMNYCGFKIMHPHDGESILRIAYVDSVDKSIIKTNIITCIEESIEIYKIIKKGI
jgi:DNA-directed RNA polymerase subunit L